MNPRGSTRAVAVWGIVVILLLAGLALTLQWARAGEHETKLPEAAEAKLKLAFPGAQIREVDEEEMDLAVYEVELMQDGREIELMISSDGVILNLKQDLKLNELPAPVANAARQLAGDGDVEEIELKETRGIVKAVTLGMPKTVYEIEIDKPGDVFEVELDETGKVLTREGKKPEHEHKHHRNHKHH